MIELVALRPKTYSYLMDDGNSDKKSQKNKKMCNKKVLKFNDYKNCLLNNEIILKLQQRFKMKHIMYILKTLTKLHYVTMMKRDCKLLIELHHIHMAQVLEKYAKQSY